MSHCKGCPSFNLSYASMARWSILDRTNTGHLAISLNSKSSLGTKSYLKAFL